MRCASPWILTAVSTPRLPHARYNPQPTGQIAVCRSTGKRWGCSVSTIGVLPMFSPLARLALHRGERASLMVIACPMFSSLDERQGIKRGRFIVLRVSALGSSPLFPLLFPHFACSIPPLTAISQASNQVDCCLPRHRQAVRLQCFYHWRVTDVSIAGPPCPPLERGACAVDAHCLIGVLFVFLGQRRANGIETRADPLAQAVFDIGWGRGYTLDMNVREIQAKTFLWPRPR